jgi:hypothetical protein
MLRGKFPAEWRFFTKLGPQVSLFPVPIFGVNSCKEGEMPFRYLGIPMSSRKLLNKDWSAVEERFQKKLSSWKGKLLLSGGRLVLINSVLSSLPMFLMSFFKIPKGVVEKLDYYRSRFFWQCDEHKKNIDWLSGVFYVNRRVLGALVLSIWRCRISVC